MCRSNNDQWVKDTYVDYIISSFLVVYGWMKVKDYNILLYQKKSFAENMK